MNQKDPNAKEGMRIRMVSMTDDPNPIAPGTEGTIRLIDGMGIIHVKWDDGRTLGVIPGVDHYQLVPDSKTDLYDETSKMFEDTTSTKAVTSAIKQTPSNVNKSMPKPTKTSQSVKSSLEKSGIKTDKVTKAFKSANIKGVKVEQKDQIKGGKADKLSIKDLAKKHKVSIEDIKKEIKIGVKIEKEHVGDDINKAKEIAMDHISEFVDYYSNKRYGVLASEKGLKKSEKKRKKEKVDKTDYMTSTAGGVSTGAYTGQAWGSGPLTKSKEIAKPGPIKEFTATFTHGGGGDRVSKKYDDTRHEAWADKNRDGWRWNDTPIWKEGEIIDPLAKIKTAWDDENLDISKEWDSLQKKKLKKEDVVKMIKNRINESKHKIVNDKKIDSVKDNFTPPPIEEEELDETTTFGSVWGSNGPPVGPAFAAKKGQWRTAKKPIWKGGTIIQKDANEGVLNPVNESFQIEEMNPDGDPESAFRQEKLGMYLVKNLSSVPGDDYDPQIHETEFIMFRKPPAGFTAGIYKRYMKEYPDDRYAILEVTRPKKGEKEKQLEVINYPRDIFESGTRLGVENLGEANKVKYNPKGKYVKIAKKCTKFPYCNQGAIDNPLKISNSVSGPGTYVEGLDDETIKNIHEISKETGKPFIEIYRMVMNESKKR